MQLQETGCGAARWAKRGRLDEWVHLYLLGGGGNRALSDGLKLAPRYYIGPMEMPAALFVRCCGPEDGMAFQVDPEGFRAKVNSLCRAIRAGVDLPPLIVQFAEGGFVLSDGNHRFEAYSQLGARTVPVIVWITEEDEYQSFERRFARYMDGAAIVRR